jgi:ABC-type transporter lipoprotein component MlaA
MGAGQMASGGIAAYQQDKAAREALAAYQANMGSPIALPVYNPATGRYENPLLADDGGVA